MPKTCPGRHRVALLALIGALCLPVAAVGTMSGTASAATAVPRTGPDGIAKVRSAYGHEETIERLKKDVEGKGIRFFMLVEQSKLAAAAGIEVRPSSLLVFGNPALGTLFIKANPLAGLDWPVRVLVYTDEKGRVWAAYTDFDWIARRHRIKSGTEPFRKASEVITSIVSSIAAPKSTTR